MDDQRFDRLTKNVAGLLSRRRLLAGLVGGVAAVSLRDASQAQGTIETVADCRARGGSVTYSYGKCGGFDFGCGAFESSWENWCQFPGSSFLIGRGCGPCLFAPI